MAISNVPSDLLTHHKPISTPLVIVAHSLGGLVVKQVVFYGISDDYENLLVTYL